MALQAGANGIPFTPVVAFLNSDYMKVNKEIKVVKDPYTGDNYAVVQALVPDVAVIHAFRGDPYGNVIAERSRDDRLLAMAAKRTIAVVEELVDPDDLFPGKYGVYISTAHIDAIVHAPKGAHPTACRGKYDIDSKHIRVYMKAAQSDDTFQKYLETYITGPESHEAYLELIGRKVNL